MKTKLFSALICVFIVLVFSSCTKTSDIPQSETTSPGSNNIVSARKTGDARILAGKIDNENVLIEDSKTIEKNLDFFGKDEYGMDYENYLSYLKGLIGKVEKYTEDKNLYIITKQVDGIDKLTDIQIGDKFYYYTEDGSFGTEVFGYYFDFDEQIGSGYIFHPIMKRQDNSNVENYSATVVSSSPDFSKIMKHDIIKSDIVSKAEELILKEVAGLEYTEFENNSEVKKKIVAVNVEDIKIFTGNYTGTGKEYLVGYKKQNSFDTFTSIIFLLDQNGDLKANLFYMKEDFNFIELDGIVNAEEANTIFMVIEGYYEGSGNLIYKVEEMKPVLIARGFYFGV
jgi:hypothetical protein